MLDLLEEDHELMELGDELEELYELSELWEEELDTELTLDWLEELLEVLKAPAVMPTSAHTVALAVATSTQP